MISMDHCGKADSVCFAFEADLSRETVPGLLKFLETLKRVTAAT